LLREAQVLLSQGQVLDVVCLKLSITRQTYYCLRKSYGGMRTDQEKRLKKFERENGRLNRLVRDTADGLNTSEMWLNVYL
jgi:hypothetical protein